MSPLQMWKKVGDTTDTNRAYSNRRSRKNECSDDQKPSVSARRQESVVATTHRNGTRSLLTSAKLSVGYLVVGFTRELDKELSLHCSSIYINIMWSVL